VSAYFDGHKEDFKIPEKRKIRFVLIDVDAIRKATVMSPAEIEQSYNSSLELYTTPEQVRASHILLSTEGKDDATVRAQAEDVLKQAKSGVDFAELAKKYSEDESNKDTGGDLDYFPRGRMVAEFDQTAFTLEPGQISDLVKTQFGYHIIKVVDKKPASTRTLDEVRAEITERLTYERATQQAGDLAQMLSGQVSKPEDLEKIAKDNTLTVQESGLFARDEAISPLGPAPEAANKAFEMNTGEAAGPIRTPRGFVFQSLLSKQDPYVPQLDEVKDRVREEVIKQKARELSQQKAVEIGAKLKAGDFEKVAAAAGLEAKTTDLMARGTPLPDLGLAPAIEDAAFALPAGAISDPITVDQGTAVIKVVEKQETAPDQLALARDKFRDELLADRRSRFFMAYMAKAKQKMKININQATLQRVVGAGG
jgi:peptidyl-prolyl cis-trans isomerase D